jgi:hypothetical protein
LAYAAWRLEADDLSESALAAAADDLFLILDRDELAVGGERVSAIS